MPAEVAYDSLRIATASDAEAAKLQEKMDGRAIAEPIVTTRGGGRKDGTFALTVFGRSVRESNCDCDRSSDASLLQTVFLQNDQETLGMINRKGSWVDQLVRTADGAKDATDPAVRRKQAERSVEQIEGFLKKAEAKGNAEATERAKKELAAAKERAEKVRDLPEEKFTLKSEDAATIIRQAYLRTLTRYPSDDEIRRAEAYFAEAGDLAIGARDLLWALLNTKEFVVNH